MAVLPGATVLPVDPPLLVGADDEVMIADVGDPLYPPPPQAVVIRVATIAASRTALRDLRTLERVVPGKSISLDKQKY